MVRRVLFISATIFRRWSSTSTSTIYALSTAPGRAAIGVIRLSGPRSQKILQRLTRSTIPSPPRTATLRRLYAPIVSTSAPVTEIIDDALTLFFPAPKSYTGEDVVELHVHGGRAVINAVMNAIVAYGRERDDVELASDLGIMGGAPVRYADPGEFTRRAYANFRMDLTEVEGVAGMIDAETETQRVAAVTAAGGYMRRLYNSWQTELLEISALMAAIIDFSEEGYFDTSGSLFHDSIANTTRLLSAIQRHSHQIDRSEILLSGVKLALLGPPNAGKSSLLNLLARRDAAIVSTTPGTTRDVVEIGLELGGYKIVLTDTAGLRPASAVGDVEAQGIIRAKQASAEADVVVAVIPAVTEDSQWHKVIKDEILTLQEIGDDDILHNDVMDPIETKEKTIIVALNKIDMLWDPEDEIPALIAQIKEEFNISDERIFPISCTEGDGIERLTRYLADSFEGLAGMVSGAPISASLRVQEIIRNDVVPSLQRFLKHAQDDDVVFASEEIRYAAEAIGKITGETTGVEDVLGVVFSRFCVGK
ncbi:GTP-binding protein TrmE N-terminus-domain-containing protein [Lipomyces orientalis]|uniref:GTP-binding protein TrmE N-terminus-domain-containing protein n=1 Tax=Lipomyces orientalis TaxID=1233043 RepID=A0ACC3TVI5_9ASCO